MTALAPPTAAQLGFVNRLITDPTFVNLVGTDEEGEVRLVWGWPAEKLKNPVPEAFPLVAYRIIDGRANRTKRGEIDIAIDMWVWPNGPNGGLARLEAIDECVFGLLHEKTFFEQGRRLYVLADDFRDFPADPGDPIRRNRTVNIRVL